MIHLLAADAVAFDVASITPAISAIGSVGFAVWHSWFVTTKTIPTQQAEHREAIKELTQTYSQTTRELVNEMKEQRESYDRWKGSHQ